MSRRNSLISILPIAHPATIAALVLVLLLVMVGFSPAAHAGGPFIEIVKTGPSTANPGDLIAFNLKVQTYGNGVVTEAVVWDNILYNQVDRYEIFRTTLTQMQLDTLNAGDPVVIDVPYQVPCDAGGHTLDNDAFVEATFSDGTTLFTGNGHDVPIPRPDTIDCSPAIDLEKFVNGEDADTAAEAVLVNLGDPLTFDYVVTNTGDAVLRNIEVVDDNETPDDTSDDFVVGTISNLAPGQSQTFTRQALAEAGLHTDVGQACGTSSATSGSQFLCDDDPANYKTRLGSLGDFVWNDLNQNGIQDADEPGIPGVTVQLKDCSGNVLATTTTDANGLYLFDNLPAGCYIVAVVPPDGFTFSPANQGDDDTVDSDVDPNTGMTGEISLGPGENNPTIDAGLFQPPALVCGLTLDKTCLVAPPPTQDLACSDKIVATTLRYTGPSLSGATVEVVPDHGATVVYSGIDLVSGETVLSMPTQNDYTVDARVSNEIDLGAKTKIYINGVEEVLHTSCSTPYLAGQPAPLDNPKGDPSPNWFVENFVDKDSPDLVELPEPPTPADACTVTPEPAPSCDTLGGRPVSLTFEYTGDSCSASSNLQGDKATCVGDSAGAEPVQIMYTGKDPDKISVTPSTETISVGDRIVLEATGRSELHADSTLEVLQGGTLLQSLGIHTSCSQPLEVGDVFGSLTLVAINGERAGSDVTYLYEVTNLGDALKNVNLVDDILGDIAGPFDLDAGGTQAFETTVDIEASTTNTGMVAGLLANGDVCEANDSVTVTVEEPVEPCGECKGGVTDLTLRYLGTAPATVAIYNDSDAKADKLLFQGLVNPGEEISISAPAGDDKLNNDISVWIDGVFNTKIHTSCSQIIGPGLIVGDFEVVEGRSKDNGPICPLFGDCQPSAPTNFQFNDRKIKWEITNAGTDPLIIQSLSLDWPSSNGDLKKVKLAGDLYTQLTSPSSVTITDWEGKFDDRTIEPGNTETLEIEFTNTANPIYADYGLLIEFMGDNCTLQFTPTPDSGTTVCTSSVQAMLLRYTGVDITGATVEFDPDHGQTVTYSGVDLVSGVTILSLPTQNDYTIDAIVSGESDLGAKTKIRINGVEEVIHTSCSAPFVAQQPAPLDDPKGDPSATWFVESFRQK